MFNLKLARSYEDAPASTRLGLRREGLAAGALQPREIERVPRGATLFSVGGQPNAVKPPCNNTNHVQIVAFV